MQKLLMIAPPLWKGRVLLLDVNSVLVASTVPSAYISTHRVYYNIGVLAGAPSDADSRKISPVPVMLLTEKYPQVR